MPTYLVQVIVAALQYKNAQDEEAVKLQQMIAEQGYEKTLQTISELDANHPLIAAVMKEV